MSANRQPPRSSRSWIFLGVRWAAALLILGILFFLLPLEPLRNALARVPLSRFIAVLLIYLVALTGGITKWHTVVNSAGAQLNFRSQRAMLHQRAVWRAFLALDYRRRRSASRGGNIAQPASGGGHHGKRGGSLSRRGRAAHARRAGLILFAGFIASTLAGAGENRSLCRYGRRGCWSSFWCSVAPAAPARTLHSNPAADRATSSRHPRGVRPSRAACFAWLLGTSVQGTYVLLTGLLV